MTDTTNEKIPASVATTVQPAPTHREDDRDSVYNEKLEASQHLENARPGDGMGGRRYEPTEEELKRERKLTRKLDRIIIPLTALMYLSAYRSFLTVLYLSYQDLKLIDILSRVCSRPR
jgi:hypothetical protein